MGKYGACVAVFLGALGAYIRHFWELVGASVLILHQHTKIAAFLLFGTIAFPRSFQISVLRAF